MILFFTRLVRSLIRVRRQRLQPYSKGVLRIKSANLRGLISVDKYYRVFHVDFVLICLLLLEAQIQEIVCLDIAKAWPI